MPDMVTLVRASWDADAAWHDAILRTYGPKAHQLRYHPKGTATPELAALYAARLQAIVAEQAAWEAHRAVRLGEAA